MQKLAHSKAMHIIGGWGCTVKVETTPSSAAPGMTCYRIVDCIDKFGNKTSASKPVDMADCNEQQQ